MNVEVNNCVCVCICTYELIFIFYEYYKLFNCTAISLSLSLPVELVCVYDLKYIRRYIKIYNKRAMKGAFHHSLTVLVCYRFPLHFYVFIKHQYLAFDVSLPPPIYLSCSPKQLDSGFNIYELRIIICSEKKLCVCVCKQYARNVCVHIKRGCHTLWLCIKYNLTFQC